MANFDQNVTINLSVESRGFESKLAAAASEIQGVKESLEGLDSDLSNATGAMNDFAAASDEPIAPELDLDGMEEEMDAFNEFAKNLETVAEKKDEVAESNKILNDRNQKTGESAREESKAFHQLIDSGSTLADVKDAAAKSNKILDKRNIEAAESAINESKAQNTLAGSMISTREAMEDLNLVQSNLSDEAEESGDSLDIETRSISEMIGEADSLSEAKHAVSNANKRMQGENEKSASTLLDEKVAAGELGQGAARLSRNLDDTSDATRSVTRSIRRMRDATHDSTQSMRAAAEVGDLFEDGLGSLSVNLGAFTIALRNFLTQIPLLLTALGAAGAAALGAASGFIVLAGALGAVVAAGALAHAQNLKNEYAEIEELGQSLEVIMRNLFDIFLEAVQPLLELQNVTSFFTDTVEGLATGVNMLSQAFAELTAESQQLRDFAEATGSELLTIQDAIDSFDGSSWENLTEALMKSWVLLGEEVTWALGAINNALADAVTRSSELLAEVNNLSSFFGQFSDTLSELAELGFTLGSGLLPVFQAFSSIVETVAGALNSMDDQMVANLVTFAGIFLATSKVANGFASIVRVVPSVVSGFRTISASAAAANSSLGGMKIAMQGVVTQVGTFLTRIGAFGGFAELGIAAASTSSAFREIAFNSAEATAHFEALALGSDVTAEDLRELAIQGRLTSEQIDALAEESDELEDSLRKTQLQAVLTEEQLDELDGVNANLNISDGVPDPGQFQETSRAASTASNSLQALSGSTAVAAKQAESAVVANGLLSTIYNNLRLSIIKTRIVQEGYRGALKSTIASVATAITQKGLMIAANLGLVSSETAAAGATVLLDAAITSLTGGLSKIIPAIIGLIVVLGALTVGVMKNMDGIKSAFEGMFNVIRAIVGALVDILLTTFVATWDALRMAIEPLLRPIKTIMMAFGGTGDAAEEGSGAISMLSTAFDLLLTVISAVIRGVGFLGKIITTVLIMPAEMLAIAIGAVIDLFQWMSSVIADVITSWGPFKQLFGDTASDADGLIDVISAVFDTTVSAMQEMGVIIEDFINDKVIASINEVITKLNTVPGINIAQVGEVSLTRDEAASTSEAEVDAKSDKTITYNEDNSTNIDQTVNADPEDQAQLSRVVTDAIEEANSFERRRQGGQ